MTNIYYIYIYIIYILYIYILYYIYIIYIYLYAITRMGWSKNRITAPQKNMVDHHLPTLKWSAISTWSAIGARWRQSPGAGLK